MEGYARELDLGCPVDLCPEVCGKLAEFRGYILKIVNFEGKPTLIALDLPGDLGGSRQPMLIRFEFKEGGISRTKLKMWSPLDREESPDRYEYVKRQVDILAHRIDEWVTRIDDEVHQRVRSANADRREADTASGTNLKSAAGVAAKALAGGAFKMGKGALKKT